MKKLLLLALVALSATAYGNTIMVYTFRDNLLIDSAAKSNDSAVLALLSIKGTDPSAQDAAGRTALHYTAQNGKLALSQALLLRGADPTIKDTTGETAYSVAEKHSQDEIMMLLEQWFKPIQGS